SLERSSIPDTARRKFIPSFGTKFFTDPPGSSLRRFDFAPDPRAGEGFEAPGGGVAQEFDEAGTRGAQPVSVPPLIRRVWRFLDPALLAQGVQPGRQDVGGYPFGRAQELVEIPLAAHEVAHDQQRPAIADDVQGA